jgi:hypothetical protein
MWMLTTTCLVQLISGNYASAKALSDELIALAEEKGAVYWKAAGLLLLAVAGKASDAVGIFTSVIPAPGTKLFLPVWLSYLAKACGELGQFDDAWSHIGEAMMAVETTKETWYEAEVHRIAGEIIARRAI